MTDKPCPLCIGGPEPTWSNIDNVWYCDDHVGQLIRETAREIEARRVETARLDAKHESPSRKGAPEGIIPSSLSGGLEHGQS
jgi:hypothetical protein